MTKMSRSFLVLGATLLLVAPISTGATPEEQQASSATATLPIGIVNATGPVDLGSSAVQSPMSNFAYFSGQRIATPSTEGARLTLTLEGGSVSLGSDSSAIVTGEPGSYRVSLEKGTASVRFGQAVDFEVATPGIRVRPHSEAGSAASAGAVEASFQLQDSRALVVFSQRGAWDASGASADERAVIEPGEVVRLASAAWPGSSPPVSAGVGGSALAATPSWIKRVAWAAGGIAVFGGAAALAVALTDSGNGNDDNPVTSPVTP